MGPVLWSYVHGDVTSRQRHVRRESQPRRCWHHEVRSGSSGDGDRVKDMRSVEPVLDVVDVPDALPFHPVLPVDLEQGTLTSVATEETTFTGELSNHLVCFPHSWSANVVDTRTGRAGNRLARTHGIVDGSATYEAVRASEARLVVANLGDATNTNITLTVREKAGDVPVAAFAEDKDSVDVLELSGATHHLKGDRLETFSYLVAGLVTGGKVRVHGCSQDRLVTAISTLAGMGARFEITDSSVAAWSDGPLRPTAIETDTHPGFMTDWQSPMVALMTQCDGLSVMYETVYENRFTYVPALNKMGAQIEMFNQPLGSIDSRFVGSSDPCSVVVRGGAPLTGTRVDVPDIRGGFAYVLAAAAAEGRTEITGTHHLDRGYNRPIENFAGLGLEITRVALEDLDG